MKLDREPRFTNLVFILVGVLGIAIAIARLSNPIEYQPSDVRSQAWFDPLVSSIMVAVSLFFGCVGAIRLLRNSRAKRP